MSRRIRPISWIKAARKEFEAFPTPVQVEILTALTIAAAGGKSDSAKPLKGLGSGVFEVALRFRTDAFRAVYAVQVGEDLWVLHAFQKKSRTGIATPKHVIDVVADRLKALKDVKR